MARDPCIRASFLGGWPALLQEARAIGLLQLEKALLCPGPTPTPTCTAPEPPSPYSIHLNAGGNTCTDTAGMVWQADQANTCSTPSWGATGGQVYTTAAAIAGTNDETIYQSERYFAAQAGYRFAVANGQYLVQLRFAEIYPYAYGGGRVFDVRAEGQTIASNLDVFVRSGGLDRAYDITASVTVADGFLNLDFVPHPGSNAPFVNAIEVTGPSIGMNSNVLPAAASRMAYGMRITEKNIENVANATAASSNSARMYCASSTFTSEITSPPAPAAAPRPAGRARAPASWARPSERRTPEWE